MKKNVEHLKIASYITASNPIIAQQIAESKEMEREQAQMMQANFIYEPFESEQNIDSELLQKFQIDETEENEPV